MKMLGKTAKTECKCSDKHTWKDRKAKRAAKRKEQNSFKKELKQS